jgi:hypothetical protein
MKNIIITKDSFIEKNKKLHFLYFCNAKYNNVSYLCGFQEDVIHYKKGRYCQNGKNNNSYLKSKIGNRWFNGRLIK